MYSPICLFLEFQETFEQDFMQAFIACTVIKDFLTYSKKTMSKPVGYSELCLKWISKNSEIISASKGVEGNLVSSIV